MNIDFKKFKVYDTLDKTTPIILDISKELANGLYKTAQGIDGHALALKIYNSTGEEDYNDLEIELIAKYANQYGTPFFIDALNSIKKLKEYGILIRHGSPKNGYWEIVDKDLQE